MVHKLQTFFFFLFVLLGSISVPLLYAGVTGKIAGRVIDEETGEPLIGANVIIESTTMGAATDMEGDYFVYSV